VKRVTLELGGKSPNIIFADADLPAAVRAPERIFYERAGLRGGIAAPLGRRCRSGRRAARGAAKKLTPAIPSIRTPAWAIVSKRQQETVLSYIAAGEKEGARLGGGGKPAK